MISEKDFVIGSWEKHFSGYVNKKIVIYGIGKNTKIIIDNFESDNIVGLMDEVRTGEIIYGKPVISIEEAVSAEVDIIIIVARASNVNVIYRRIERQADENAIDVFDMNGDKLAQKINPGKNMKSFYACNEAVLKRKIEQASVVSFDIFDTLIMRRCLYPRDIFRIIGEEFAKERIKAEAELYAEGKHPNIFDIYSRMGNRWSPQNEIDLEIDYLIARRAMVEMLNYAKAVGKKVFLTSDMYLPSETICRILKRLDINFDVENIIVSCNHGLSKPQGLFNVLKQKSDSSSILHIGDDYETDVLSAERYGLEAFYVESAATMLEGSPGAHLLKFDGSLPNCLVLGRFIASQLNDPFIFERTQGKFEINSNFDMAYSFVAPLIVSFFHFMAERAIALDLDLILLGSRDGYIIERIYDIYKDRLSLPEMKYFYVSRAVCVVAGLVEDEDILHAAHLAFAGSPKEMLKERFRLKDCDITERAAGENGDDYILRHRQAILDVAERERERYLRYIDTFNIKKGTKVGFFDFISSGTCQKTLSNIVDFDLVGLYVAAVNYTTDYKSDTVIEAMYKKLNVFEKNHSISVNFFFLEHMMASHEATLSGFDDKGVPCYMPECRTEGSLKALDEIHRGILDYADQTYRDDWQKVDISLPDCIVGLVSDEYAQMNTTYFSDEELNDEFCKRKFSLS